MSEGNGTANATGSAYPEMPADYSPRFAPNFESMNDAQLRHLVVNIQSRQDWLINALSDKSRNLYSACRVDEPHTVTPQKYMEMFQYNPVGGRVVEVLPKESWQVCPCVYEKESGKATTPFEKDWKALSKQLLSNGIPSHYNDDDATAIWEPLTRADIMSGIGQFGLVLLGLADGAADLLQPAKPRKGQKLNFLQVYSDYECKISKYDTDPTSPRYGRPLSYQVTSAGDARGQVRVDVRRPPAQLYVRDPLDARHPRRRYSSPAVVDRLPRRPTPEASVVPARRPDEAAPLQP